MSTVGITYIQKFYSHYLRKFQPRGFVCFCFPDKCDRYMKEVLEISEREDFGDLEVRNGFSILQLLLKHPQLWFLLSVEEENST